MPRRRYESPLLPPPMREPLGRRGRREYHSVDSWIASPNEALPSVHGISSPTYSLSMRFSIKEKWTRPCDWPEFWRCVTRGIRTQPSSCAPLYSRPVDPKRRSPARSGRDSRNSTIPTGRSSCADSSGWHWTGPAKRSPFSGDPCVSSLKPSRPWSSTTGVPLGGFFVAKPRSNMFGT